MASVRIFIIFAFVLHVVILLNVIGSGDVAAFKLNSFLLNNFLKKSTVINLGNDRCSLKEGVRTIYVCAVPKKKSSHRRTRRRKVAWMKKNPAKLYRTSSYDMDEIMRYTDRKLTAHYTTRDNWLNLPSTSLVNNFFLFREIRN